MGSIPPKAVRRSVVEDFFSAFAACDFARFAAYLDDDIQWSISGPVDLLSFCGQHSGKAAVLNVITRLVPQVLESRELVPEMTLVDGDCAAVLARVQGIQRGSGHAISYRIAFFLRFKNDKLVEYKSVFDTFNAAEQVAGHRFGPTHDAPSLDSSKDLVAI